MGRVFGDCKQALLFVAAILSLTLLVANAQDGDNSGDNSHEDYLDPHNAARATVGVQPLSWSSDLEDYARTYAESQVEHCLPLTHSHGPHGENLFWGSGKDWTPQDAVTAWTGEAPDYDYDSNSCVPGKMCGHYTQVVWKSTTHVGCAKVECNDGANYILCSYDPPGNWIGEQPF